MIVSLAGGVMAIARCAVVSSDVAGQAEHVLKRSAGVMW
jgi:hypothetical protein